MELLPDGKIPRPRYTTTIMQNKCRLSYDLGLRSPVIQKKKTHFRQKKGIYLSCSKRPTRVIGQSQTVRPATAAFRPLYRTPRTRSTDAVWQRIGKQFVFAGVTCGQPGPSRQSAPGSPPSSPLHRGKRKLCAIILRRRTSCDRMRASKRRKWRGCLLFARFVTCMGNDRLPKLEMFGEVEGENVHSVGQERN